ncbi:hypothetical protein A3F00_02190 [Candidatus Daviesbacteria bacterium RIFCSPHIGHO2_12_FULL_37_11]|uniref:Uncharacterized protein n=1 Tax=Candidatus Daviesbacteria bacterium RIFCSPHIGHO2_12_FULL_37_11 TaxID=1797777 RepID=A0A1F5K976_9BACT|nr:MAG: hypothetical protein A3F00_02190 [Candidatus Daviesbacteria bacterium RIFCSPHIGHO2_12_FULL_37_11]
MSEDSTEIISKAPKPRKARGGLTEDSGLSEEQLGRSRGWINGLGVNKTRIVDQGDTNKPMWFMKSPEPPVSIKSRKIQQIKEKKIA